MSRIAGIVRQLRHRKVFSTAAIYIVAAWIVLQVADLAFPGLGISEAAIRYVWIGVLLGFPLALVFGWLFQVTPRGIARTTPQKGFVEADISLTKTDYILLTGLGIIGIAIVVGVMGEIRNLGSADPASLSSRDIDPHSVAVLPLGDFTGDPDQAYFVAGMHEALISGLSRISALKVISRTSADVYKDVVKPLPEIARELRVANIVEGSVYRSGDDVRITVQLIDAISDKHIWVDEYERNLRDVFSLQGEVARAIAEQIQITLTDEEDRRLRVVREVGPEAYEAYLRGMFHLKQYTPEGIQKGLRYLDEAIALDPRNAGAYAGLALGYNTIGHGIGRDAFPKAMAAARHALEIDEFSGEAWAALSEAQLYYDWDWTAAEESANLALQLNSNLDHAHAHFAYLLVLLGRWDEAVAEAEEARRLSPLDPTWAAFAAWLYVLGNRYEEAYVSIDEALEVAPGNPLSLYVLGQILTSHGRYEAAIEAHEKIPRENPLSNWSLGPTYAMAGWHDEALSIAEAMKVNPGPKDRLHLAFTYAALGDIDNAMLWLESSYENRVDWLPWIGIGNSFGGALEGIRDKPRFQAFLAKLKLPSAASTEMHGSGQ